MDTKQKLLGFESTAVVPVKADKGGLRTVKIIDAGWGSSGYYAPDMLEKYATEAFPSGTHSYVNHPSQDERWNRPERSILDIAGVLATAAKWDAAGPDGPGVYAKLSVRPSMETTVSELQDYIGVSINCMMETEFGEAPDGRSGPIVNKLFAHTLNSVDLVTHAGRGGAIVKGAESAAMKLADEAYLTAAGISVPSPTTTRGKETILVPKKGIKMAELSDETAKALADALKAQTDEMRTAREAATATAASSAVSPIASAVALTKALKVAKMPESFHAKVLEDVERGDKPSDAIARWEDVAKLIPATESTTGTQPVVNTGVHIQGGGAPQADIDKMFGALTESYQSSAGFGIEIAGA